MTEGVSWIRLAIWSALTAGISYLAFAGDSGDLDDAFFEWSTFAATAIGAALLIAIALAVSAGRPGLRAFRQSRISVSRATGLGLLAVLATYVASALVITLGGDPGGEQGLLPDGWQPGRTAPFVANAIGIVVFPALSEELFARGVGFGLFRPFGRAAAIVFPAFGWALMHGLPTGIVPLFVLGLGLGYLRERSDSIVPGIVVHGAFNGLALGLAFV